MTDLVDQPGWVYICMDVKNPNECKVGMTTRPLYNRITETGNPDYMIVKAYKVPCKEALAIEKHLQREVAKVACRKPHVLTGKPSEWFECSPKEAAVALEHDLAKCLELQDEDGNAMLEEVIFKPHLDFGNKMLLAERIGDTECYNNIITAINDA